MTIHDLAAKPIAVPTLLHTYGGVLTGPTGEAIRIADVASYSGQYGLNNGVYRGGLLSKAIIAFYKVANGGSGRAD